MKALTLAVIIPIGPGHKRLAVAAQRSVVAAWRHPGPFAYIDIIPISDPHGALGRSAARNKGMDACLADWYFFLDADDVMMPDALTHVQLDAPATFGAVHLSRGRIENQWPATKADLVRLGPLGTLSMGCFVRGDLGVRFNETLDVGEDFDFYMRLPGFVKVQAPLVCIGYHHPSAVGPRASKQNWATAAWERIHANA